MARVFLKTTPQIEADRNLLRFSCYEEYLDSLSTVQDACYLQSVEASRTVANLGYRSSGETLSREQFERRLAAVLNYLYPPYKAYELSSEGMVPSQADAFLIELASRERANRIGILSTIVFLRAFTKTGIELSGYIDYTERLYKEDWKPIFKGEKYLLPKRSDLGFHHWKSGDVVSNDSLNYKVHQHPAKGLIFQNRFDRKSINPDPLADPEKLPMARSYLRATPQVEADRTLLRFSCYEEYLDSLSTLQDACYLQSIEAARTVANLGYRSSGETLSREQFERRLAAVLHYLYPPYKAYELSSEAIVSGRADTLIIELASRERANRTGILSTIIFLRAFTKTGIELSGYIDYAERLSKEDWKPIFKGDTCLMPKKTDLGFYHWKVGDVVSNDSFNYKVLQHPTKGLIFQNRFDRKTINPDPLTEPGPNTSRKRIYTKIYELCILFDHVVRQRI